MIANNGDEYKSFGNHHCSKFVFLVSITYSTITLSVFINKNIKYIII